MPHILALSHNLTFDQVPAPFYHFDLGEETVNSRLFVDTENEEMLPFTLCHQEIEKGKKVIDLQCDNLHSVQSDLGDF